MSPSQAEAVLGVAFQVDKDSSPDLWSCHYERPRSDHPGLFFMVEEGKITRIDVVTAGISTIHGIRVGDTEEAVKEKASSPVTEYPHPYLGERGKYLIIPGRPGFAFLFEIEDGSVSSFRSGRLAAVEYMEGCL